VAPPDEQMLLAAEHGHSHGQGEGRDESDCHFRKTATE